MIKDYIQTAEDVNIVECFISENSDCVLQLKSSGFGVIAVNYITRRTVS